MKQNSGFVTLLGAGELRNIVQNGMASFRLHQCSQPSVIDTTGNLTRKEKAALARGLKVVDLTKSEKDEALIEISNILNAKLSTTNGTHRVEIPEAKFSKRCLGPYVGLAAQTVIVQAQPALTLSLRPFISDQSMTQIKTRRDTGVFKKSDKGSSLVYLSKEAYRSMGLKYLNTPNYQVIDAETDNGLQAMERLFNEASKSKDCAKLIQAISLLPKRERHIYFLPKIHKPLDVDSLYKVRPIVDCCETALAAADKVAAMFLSSLNKHMFTIATSTIDLLKDIHATNTVGIDVWFYTADVEDLYTNVDVNGAIEAIEELIDEFGIGTVPQRQFIVSVLRICLANNLFWFGDRRYRQMHGIPMGSNSAPVVADAWLFKLERTLVSNALSNSNAGILAFRRYRDDIFAIATSEAAARQLDAGYKALHPRIRLESEFSNTKANVLDVAISKFEDDGSIRTGAYFKATNSLPLLHRSSNHPLSTLRGAIKGRFISFVRICNNTTDLFSAILSLAKNAANYGYTEEEVLGIARDAILQCSKLDWPHLRPKDDCFKQDYRTNNVVRYVRGLEPLYQAAKRRKIKVSLSEGKSLINKLCRTKDH
jgi:hypothetical protein